MASTVHNHVSTFVLNDITLTVPPTAIKITKDSFNYQWQTLRTNTSQKTKSGHSTLTVEFTVPFIGFHEIHTKLKPLIAELRYMPFCYAENQFLRENIFPQEKSNNGLDTDKQTIVLALRGCSISARNDMPGTIMATFQFAYFNYLPYTPYWQYKADLFGPDANKTVTFPSESKAWQKFVQPSISKSTVSTSPSGEAQINFLEIRTAPKSSVQTISQTKEILSSISNNQKQFFDNFRAQVAETPDDAIKNAVRQTFPQFSNVQDLAAIDLLGPLLVNAGPTSNPLSKRYNASGNYIDQAQLKQTLNELDQRLSSREDLESDNPANQDGYKLIESLIFQDNRGTGYGVFKRIRGLALNGNNGIIIEGITISIQNILATIPLIGHRYATFQHIGSIDATVYIDAKVTNDKAMSSLAWLYDTVNQNMLENRHIPQGLQAIQIDNDVLALFNLNEFITQDMETSTIEGSPGTYQVKLSFIESGLKQNDKLDVPPNDKFNLEYASSDPRVAKEIVRILNTSIKGNPSANNRFFTSDITDNKNARYGSIVGKYIGSTQELANELKAKGALPGGNRRPPTALEARLQQSGALPKSVGNNGGPNSEIFGSLFSNANSSSNNQATGATTISSTTSLNTFADQVSDLIFRVNPITSNGFGAPTFAGDFSPAGMSGLRGQLDTSTIGNEQYFNILMALSEDDVPGISKVQEVILAKSKQQNNLNKDISSQVNKPLADLQRETRTKVARGAEIDRILKEQATFNQINFDSTDQSFFNSVTGFSNAPPSTPQGQTFTQMLNNSAVTLLKTDPFIKWMEFISNLTVAIIESDDLELPEFTSAKALVKDLRLGRGLPAYPDFHLEDILPDDHKDDIDTLLSLDPDCYLSTPLNVSLNNFIDPALVANAKRIAQTSFQSSLNNVHKFYNDSWLPSFISDSIRDKITKNLKATVFQFGSDNTVSSSNPISADDYYQKSIGTGKYANSGSNESIVLGTLDIDKNKIHASDSSPTTLQITAGINHSLNPMDLFQGGTPNIDFSNANLTKAVNHEKNNHQGRKVTNSPQGFDGIVNHSPQDLASQAGTDLDTYALARCIASEEGRGNEPTKTAIGWAIKNAAANAGSSISDWLLFKRGHVHYKAGFFGHGGGRDAATNYDPSEQDLRIAKLITQNKVSDPTGGATQFSDVKAQNNPLYKKAATQLALNQGRGTGKGIRVPSEAKLIDERAKDGRVVVIPEGTDPNKITFFKPTRTKVKPFAYTPPTPQTPAPDTGLAAGSNVADLAIQAFQASINNGQAMRMVRAFPTFKLYFIGDNSENRRRYGLDDFYSYNSVVDITCVRSRKIPADLLEVTLTNVSGVLSNRRFQGARKQDKSFGFDASAYPLDKDGNPIHQDPNAFLDRNANGKENTLASMMLQSGTDIELRLGTSNDPDRLTTVFNGKIMEVEFSDSDDLVRIICQSHAIELVQDMKGLAEPIVKKGWFISDARTDILLERLMGEPEVLHFGRWIRSQAFNSDTNTNRFLLANKFELSPTPQDDNIFVPPIKTLREIDPGFLFSDIKYSIYQTTIWDIFDEMTLRHPGYVRAAVPYKGKEGPRMTMFFGLPSQLYFAADPSAQEKTAGSQLKQQVTSYNNNIDELFKTTGVVNPDLLDKFNTGHLDQALPLVKQDFAAKRLQLAKDFQSIKPFRAYHLVTSKNHIICNNIRASAKGTHNTISIQYGDGKWNKDTQKLVQEGTDVLTLSIDAALPDEEIRELFVQYANCQSKLMAKNYATALLMRELKEVYRGELTIIGNPDIKPLDCVTIFDDTSDIMGTIEVEQVIHKFSQDTGFITEITPDLFVTANEWVNMTANDMMSIIMEGAASALTHGAPTTSENVITSPITKTAALGAFALGLGASPLIAIIGAGAAIGGYFIMQKMVDFTSHGQPVVMHPLIHRGKPWIAGLPIGKLNNLWSTNKGEWLKEGFDGSRLWLDDANDSFTLAASQGSFLNLFTGNAKGPQF